MVEGNWRELGNHSFLPPGFLVLATRQSLRYPGRPGHPSGAKLAKPPRVQAVSHVCVCPFSFDSITPLAAFQMVRVCQSVPSGTAADQSVETSSTLLLSLGRSFRHFSCEVIWSDAQASRLNNISDGRTPRNRFFADTAHERKRLRGQRDTRAVLA